MIKTVGIKKIIFLSILFIGFGCDARTHQPPQGSGKPPSIEKIFEDLDADEDGKISEAEAKGPLKDHFDELDTDSDGSLSKEEIENAPKPERR